MEKTQSYFADLAQKRQSDRVFEERPVEREKLQQCIETTRLAPSANNSQPWKFVVVDDPELKAKVGEAAVTMGLNKFTRQAPVIVAVVHEKQNLMSVVGGALKDKDFSFYDIGIAVNQFCLQATDLGLGTCVIGWFDERKIRKLLHIGRRKRIPLLIAVGYAEGETRIKKRKKLEEMSSWNRY